MSTTPERFTYEPWRHGGWYVGEVHYASGAVGCVSRNYPDRKWRIVCDDRPGSFPGGPNDHTYPNRDAAARAEWEIAETQRADLIAAGDYGPCPACRRSVIRSETHYCPPAGRYLALATV